MTLCDFFVTLVPKRFSANDLSHSRGESPRVLKKEIKYHRGPVRDFTNDLLHGRCNARGAEAPATATRTTHTTRGCVSC